MLLPSVASQLIEIIDRPASREEPMEILRHLEVEGLACSGSVATLGNFDGIHLGHQALLRQVVEEARRLQLPSVVLTFEPHPLKVLAPDRAPKMILSHKDKMQLLQSFGVDIVVIQNFDASFSSLEAETFVRRYLTHGLKVKKIWVGRDLRFGRGRQGCVQDLVQWGGVMGFTVGVVDPILVEGMRVSSSRIRQWVEEGRVDEAKPLLGRYHFLTGRVVKGHERGRRLGFPTANIASRTEVLPGNGIYATLFQLREKTHLSVSSIGVNPTFGAGPRTVESFIFDFDESIYGESVKLSFVKRIRHEIKFWSVEPLVEQMHQDVEIARSLFNDLGMVGYTQAPE